MADLIKKIKIKKQDGTFTDYIPIGADAVNVETSDGESVELKLNKKPYCYDTIANMKADNKLKAGDICQTLGYNNLNDGDSGKYKIVNDSQLVNDGINTINLNNGLKAIKIYEKMFPNFFLGAFFDVESPYNIHFFVSLDGLNLSQLNLETNIVLQGRDPSIVYNKNNNKFYLTHTSNSSQYDKLIIYESSDLKNWVQHSVDIKGINNSTAWAPDLFIDEDTNILYCIISSKYGTENDVYNNIISAFDEYIISCTDFNNLTFSTARKLDLSESEQRNHIDGSLSKMNNKFYLTVKNEYNKTIEIFESTDLINFHLVNSNLTKSNLALEGCQIIPLENEVLQISDAYLNGRYTVSKTLKNDFPNFNQPLQVINTLNNYSHGSLIYIKDAKCKNIITNLADFNFNNNNNYEENIKSGQVINKNTTYLNENLCILPNSLVTVGGTRNDIINVSLRNPFKLEYFDFCFSAEKDVTLNIIQIDDTILDNPISFHNNVNINQKILSIPIKYPNRVNINSYSNNYLTLDDITIDSEDFEITGFNFIKQGNGVMMAFNLKCLVTGYENGKSVDSIFTLPVGYRPLWRALIQNDKNMQNLQITNTGFLNGTITLNQNQSAYCSITYITGN